MKTRTPTNNLKNLRRARVIKALEVKVRRTDKELIANKPSLTTAGEVKEYREQLHYRISVLKEIQHAKGGSI